MNIRFARTTPDEADVLSALAIESKGYWGYPRAQLEIWRKHLRITPDYILSNTVVTIWMETERVGFFAIQKGSESILDHLWLLPRAIGQGVGAAAFREIERECEALNIHEFVIISDPNAEGFYLRQGAVRIGEVKSVPQNRLLPKLRYHIRIAL
ncbi:MAG: GNAT family N-acetyltransferase [Opitutales bacterium]|nr:GNAT family N-acetyltransferase [Opitutales bacterium]